MPSFPHRSQMPQPGDLVDSCCFPTCHAPVTEQVDLPLCSNHCLKVHQIVNTLLDPGSVRDFLSRPTRAALRPVAPERADGFVYFVRMGNRVKIGHSSRPLYRLKQIPHEEVLMITVGSTSDEKATHRKFAHLRTNGEWFRAEPELLEFASKLPRSPVSS